MDGSNSAGHLRSLVERTARLLDEIDELREGVKEIKSEAKSQGFDVKALTHTVKKYRMSAEERAADREFEAVCELYAASLGMLDGTPLGDAARRRASQPPASPKNDDPSDESPRPEDPVSESEFPAEDLELAKERGREDAGAGMKVLDNPYLSGDPRRAKWDEGWCEARGSDGMDLPEAWRRKQKSKKDEKLKEPQQ